MTDSSEPAGAGTAEITVARLRELLEYDPAAGVFTWRVARSQLRAGHAAGHRNPKTGYVRISLDKTTHLAHRLAWLYVYGKLPDEQLDHIDGNPTNNRISNLREATALENTRNSKPRFDNTSGFRGVDKQRNGRWRAKIKVCGVTKTLGYFDTAEQAYATYREAVIAIHGEFARVE